MHLSLSSPSVGSGPYRNAVALEGIGPEAFLAAAEGLPRGYWGRGDRWIAWAGVLARIEPPLEGHSRFEGVRIAADRALGRLGGPGGTSLPPRFFGGFSFLDEAPVGAPWMGFPAALFILPRFVLEGSGAGPTAGGVLAGAADVEELEGFERRLRAVGPEAGRPPGPLPPPALAVLPGVEGADEEARDRWKEGVRRALAAIREGRVEKAVLARHLAVELPDAVQVPEAVARVRNGNPAATGFLFEPEPGRAFLGAAPELLASLRDRRFEATAVAGSIARSNDPATDASRAEHLLASAKDRAEHRVTVEDMVEVLIPHLARKVVPADPGVLTLARIHHLETVIRGVVEGEGRHVLELVEALHPTPAVCGRPRLEALRLLRAEEPFERGWYAGPVGWFVPSGDGEFVPALRSAVGEGRRWHLHAGAGIVEGSDPDAEWEETALKFEPALQALLGGSPDQASEG